VSSEQFFEHVASFRGAGGLDATPSQLPVARQISNGEDLFVLAVNQLRGLAVIHGPYGSRSMPLQTVSLSLVTATPHCPVSAQEICQNTAP
jgi:hypothetical protein